MERRLRTVEETLRNGNGSYSRVGPTQRAFIRPGRPDMSHVSGSAGPKGYDNKKIWALIKQKALECSNPDFEMKNKQI